MTTILLQGAGAQGGGMSFILMMVLLFGIMWLFMIRPQQKKQKEIQKFQNSLEVGQNVVTGGGLYGVVKFINVNANYVEIEVAKGVTVRVDKHSVYKDMASQPQQPKK